MEQPIDLDRATSEYEILYYASLHSCIRSQDYRKLRTFSSYSTGKKRRILDFMLDAGWIEEARPRVYGQEHTYSLTMSGHRYLINSGYYREQTEAMA